MRSNLTFLLPPQNYKHKLDLILTEARALIISTAYAILLSLLLSSDINVFREKQLKF